jgi:hypothetical protein
MTTPRLTADHIRLLEREIESNNNSAAHFEKFPNKHDRETARDLRTIAERYAEILAVIRNLISSPSVGISE